MKKYLIIILTLICLTAFAEVETILIPQGTNSVATLTLDTRKGVTTPIPIVGLSDLRMTAYAAGNAAATNGQLVIYLETAPSRTGPYTLYSDSNLKLTITANGAATNSMSDRFNFSGIEWVRVGAVSNSSAGTFTNMVIQITYPQPTSHR